LIPAVLAGWLQQADAMARQVLSNKNDFFIFIDEIEFSDCKGTVEILFSIKEYMDNEII